LIPIKRVIIPIAAAPVKKVAVEQTARGKELLDKLRLEAESNEWMTTIARYAQKVKNPRTAIRAKCVECSGGSLKEVNECPVDTCALHPFRMGVNPFNKKTQARLASESGEVPEDDEDDEDETEDETATDGAM